MKEKKKNSYFRDQVVLLFNHPGVYYKNSDVWKKHLESHAGKPLGEALKSEFSEEFKSDKPPPFLKSPKARAFWSDIREDLGYSPEENEGEGEEEEEEEEEEKKKAEEKGDGNQ